MNDDMMSRWNIDLPLSFVPPTADKNCAAAQCLIALLRSRQQQQQVG
jgi:hypothetical protein